MQVLFAGFDLCDPTTSVSMTINGPAPTILAMFLNTAIDQQLGALRRPSTGGRPTPPRRPSVRAAVLRDGPGHRAGRHPEGGPGPEHLHLLHRVLARVMADMQEWFIDHQVRELLLGVDLRLPHRRGRGQPHHPAGLHPGQRLHLRRGVPGPGHGGRRLRPQPLVLLLQRHGPRVHGDRPGGPAHLGGGHARPLRRRASGPSGSSTTSRPRGGRCTPRRWRSTTSAPPSRPCAPSTTTPTASTPTPTTRR